MTLVTAATARRRTTFRPRTIAVLLFFCGLALGIGVGWLLSTTPAPGPISDSEPPFPVNSHNLTYGQVDQRDARQEAPDLVAVTTQDGAEGWAYSDQLLFDPPATPPQRSQGSSRQVPVYDLEGVDLLGYALVD